MNFISQSQPNQSKDPQEQMNYPQQSDQMSQSNETIIKFEFIEKFRSKTTKIEAELDQMSHKHSQKNWEVCEQLKQEITKAHDRMADKIMKAMKESLNEIELSKKQQIKKIKQTQAKNQEELQRFCQVKMEDLFQDIYQAEKALVDMQRFARLNSNTDVLDLIVGGQKFTVGRNLLVSIKGSKMSELFNNMHHLKMVEGDQIFLDRDPEAFNNVLRYLRTNRKFLPSDTDQNLRKLVELEIKYWEVNKGLSNSLIESDLQRKIEELLNSVPNVNPQKQQKSLQNWKKLGPLSIQDYLDNIEEPLDFNGTDFEFKQVINEKGSKWLGQFRKGTDISHGINRMVFSDNEILEAQYKEDQISGYGRKFYANGAIYIGHFKESAKNGKGKLINPDGSIQLGTWEKGEYIGY